MDDVFRLLAARQRRRLLVTLLGHNPQPAAPPIVRSTIHQSDSDSDRLQLAMYHKHLPMLENAGVIRWDRGAHEVHTGPRFEEIRPLLELLNDNADELPGEWV